MAMDRLMSSFKGRGTGTSRQSISRAPSSARANDPADWFFRFESIKLEPEKTERLKGNLYQLHLHVEGADVRASVQRKSDGNVTWGALSECPCVGEEVVAEVKDVHAFSKPSKIASFRAKAAELLGDHVLSGGKSSKDRLGTIHYAIGRGRIPTLIIFVIRRGDQEFPRQGLKVLRDRLKVAEGFSDTLEKCVEGSKKLVDLLRPVGKMVPILGTTWEGAFETLGMLMDHYKSNVPRVGNLQDIAAELNRLLQLLIEPIEEQNLARLPQFKDAVEQVRELALDKKG